MTVTGSGTGRVRGVGGPAPERLSGGRGRPVIVTGIGGTRARALGGLTAGSFPDDPEDR
jgi:hypothetical protein